MITQANIQPHPPRYHIAMDGYALSSHLTTHASPTNPIKFKVIGSIGAGDEPIVISSEVSSAGDPRSLGQKDGLDEEAMEEEDEGGERTCYEIMTGAPFPILKDGDDDLERDQSGSGSGTPRRRTYDACVRHESIIIHPDDQPSSISTLEATPTSFPRARYITLHAPISAYANRKLAGEDFRVGDLLAREGEEVSGGKVMVLASTGLNRLSVRRESGGWAGGARAGAGRQGGLRIGVLTTGKEVAHNHNIGSAATSTTTEPSQTSLEKGHIFNSNAPYLLATLRSWGHDPVLIPAPQQDTATGFQDCLRRATEMSSDEGDIPHLDLIITTGGVSAGKHDYVPGSVVALGGQVVFHKTIIRPGFPLLFGDVPRRGGGRLPIFGLPGNPIAVAACLRFLVVEFLNGAMGSPGTGKVGIKLARLLPADFASSSTITTIAGCGMSKESNAAPRTRSHKKPLMTRCFMPARYHAQRPSGFLAEESPSASPNLSAAVPGLDLIPWVEPLTRSASLTKAMSEANCWVILPEGKDVYEEGEVVEIVDMQP